MAEGSVTLSNAVGNGSATCSFVSSREYDPGRRDWIYDTYEISATTDSGWSFKRWEMRHKQRTSVSGSPGNWEWGSWEDWQEWVSQDWEDGIQTIEFIIRGGYGAVAGGHQWERNYEIRPVFEQIQVTRTISVSANPPAGGTVSGGGTYSDGASCTVSASPSSGYRFLKWTENGSKVSGNAPYTFIVSSDRALVANFWLKTGKLLCTGAGKMLCDSSGNLLYDG